MKKNTLSSILLSSANSNETMTNVVPPSTSTSTTNSSAPEMDVSDLPSDNNRAQQVHTELCNQIKLLGNIITEVAEGKHDRFLCVIDFEATCMKNIGKKFFPHEIIEFPAVLINVATRKIVSSFHAYCKPHLNPVLSNFCKELTGISQEIIDNSESFPEVYSRFLIWLQSQTSNRVEIVTDGPYDMSKFLYLQCLISQIEFPKFGEHFINIKDTYEMEHKIQRAKLMDMLQTYGLKFEGRLHSGKDDAQNIARLVVAMLGHLEYIESNTQIPYEEKKYLEQQMAAYYRRRQNQEDRKRRRTNKKRKSSKVFEEYYLDDFWSMDIDPDLIGSESILLKHKIKK